MSLCPFLAVRLRLKLANPPLDVKPVSSDAVRTLNGRTAINCGNRERKAGQTSLLIILLLHQRKKNHSKERNSIKKPAVKKWSRPPLLPHTRKTSRLPSHFS